MTFASKQRAPPNVRPLSESSAQPCVKPDVSSFKKLLSGTERVSGKLQKSLVLLTAG